MKTAVITPVCPTSQTWLRKSLASITCQSVPSTAFLVAEGNICEQELTPEVKIIRLPQRLTDDNKAAYVMGAISAICQEYDGLAFLAAMNWYEPRHLEFLLACHQKTGAVICSSSRRFIDSSGGIPEHFVPFTKEPYSGIDSLFLTRKAFGILHEWFLTPSSGTIESDRSLWKIIQSSGLAMAHHDRPTLNYRVIDADNGLRIANSRQQADSALIASEPPSPQAPTRSAFSPKALVFSVGQAIEQTKGMPNRSASGGELKPGSNAIDGWLYHEMPGVDQPAHRHGTRQRAAGMAAATDLRDCRICDLGCSSGGIAMELARLCHCEVRGFDYDRRMVELGNQIADTQQLQVHLEYAHLSPDFISSLPSFDVIVWMSQWQWFVREHGIRAGLDALYTLSRKGTRFFFETATTDGACPLPASLGVASQLDLFKILAKSTVYQEIRPIHRDANYFGRVLWFCQSAVVKWTGMDSASVYRSGRETVDKITHTPQMASWEASVLRRLARYPYVPRVLGQEGSTLSMSYEGPPLEVFSDGDLAGILAMLRQEGIEHRDIRPQNLTFNGTNAVLLDFGWASVEGNSPRQVTDTVGIDFRAPHGIDDEWSLRKVQDQLRSCRHLHGT